MTFIVEFGSAKRGDSGFASDKDLLLVYDQNTELMALKNYYLGKGYSVSCFSKVKSNYLIESGSLFFKHIRDEGRLLHGDRISFEETLKKWAPKNNYEYQIEENFELLDVLRFLPNVHDSYLFANDLIISSLRNVLIRKIANYGIYEFSWNRIFAVATELDIVPTLDIYILRVARIYKNLYRLGYRPKISESYIQRLLNCSFNVLSSNSKIEFSSLRRLDRFYHECKEGSYRQLRALELINIAYFGDKSLRNYNRIICDPNYFGNIGGSLLN